MFPEGRALEFLLAAVIALVVVGPKDLPLLMRKLGQFVGRMRAMAAEFRASFDEMARQSELDELRKEVEAMRSAQFTDVVAHTGQAEVQDVFADIQQNLSGVASDLHAETTPSYYQAPSEPAAPVEAEAKPAPKPRAKRATATKTAPKRATKAAAASDAARKTAKPRTRKKPETEA
jgi:sec-independent protein translocase protein TatB